MLMPFAVPAFSAITPSGYPAKELMPIHGAQHARCLLTGRRVDKVWPQMQHPDTNKPGPSHAGTARRRQCREGAASSCTSDTSVTLVSFNDVPGARL